jgi:hypothetical protein
MTNYSSGRTVTITQLQAEMPEAIRHALPVALWNKEQLWALDLPVNDVNVNTLDYLLDLPIWDFNGDRFQVKPSDVLAQPSRYPDHYQRILNCDLSYPIHVTRQNGRLTIADGLHRLAKAAVQGDATIKAMELSPLQLASISVDSKRV